MVLRKNPIYLYSNLFATKNQLLLFSIYLQHRFQEMKLTVGIELLLEHPNHQGTSFSYTLVYLQMRFHKPPVN